MAGTYNLKIDQGATLRLWFESPDFDLSGYTSRAVLAHTMGGDPVLELTEGVGLMTEQGGIQFEIHDAISSELSGGGVWMLEVTNGTSTYRLLEGSWVVHPEV